MEAQLRRTAWLLLSLVLLAASPVASQTDALASYTRMPGRNLKINDYTCAGTTSGPGYCQLGGSPADAAQKCNQDPNCHGFVFILGTGGNFYYLKGGSSAPLDVSKATQDPATDLYVKQGSGAGSPPPPGPPAAPSFVANPSPVARSPPPGPPAAPALVANPSPVANSPPPGPPAAPAFVASAASPPPPGGSSAGTYTQYQATNYKPGDFDCPGTKTPGYCNFDGSPTDAKAKCNSVTGCEGFVFILGTSGNFYYLKSGPGDTLLDPSLKTYDPATDFYYRQPSAVSTSPTPLSPPPALPLRTPAAVSTPSPTVAPLASPIPAALSPSPTAPALVAATKAPLSPPAPTAAATVAANPAPLSPPPPSSPASIAATGGIASPPASRTAPISPKPSPAAPASPSPSPPRASAPPLVLAPVSPAPASPSTPVPSETTAPASPSPTDTSPVAAPEPTTTPAPFPPGPVETNLASPEAPPLVAASPQPPSPTLPAVALLIPINGPPSPRTTPSPTEPAITPAIVPPVVAPVPAPVGAPAVAPSRIPAPAPFSVRTGTPLSGPRLAPSSAPKLAQFRAPQLAPALGTAKLGKVPGPAPQLAAGPRPAVGLIRPAAGALSGDLAAPANQANPPSQSVAPAEAASPPVLPAAAPEETGPSAAAPEAATAPRVSATAPQDVSPPTVPAAAPQEASVPLPSATAPQEANVPMQATAAPEGMNAPAQAPEAIASPPGPTAEEAAPGQAPSPGRPSASAELPPAAEPAGPPTTAPAPALPAAVENATMAVSLRLVGRGPDVFGAESQQTVVTAVTQLLSSSGIVLAAAPGSQPVDLSASGRRLLGTTAHRGTGELFQRTPQWVGSFRKGVVRAFGLMLDFKGAHGDEINVARATEASQTARRALQQAAATHALQQVFSLQLPVPQAQQPAVAEALQRLLEDGQLLSALQQAGLDTTQIAEARINDQVVFSRPVSLAAAPLEGPIKLPGLNEPPSLAPETVVPAPAAALAVPTAPPSGAPQPAASAPLAGEPTAAISAAPEPSTGGSLAPALAAPAPAFVGLVVPGLAAPEPAVAGLDSAAPAPSTSLGVAAPAPSISEAASPGLAAPEPSLSGVVIPGLAAPEPSISSAPAPGPVGGLIEAALAEPPVLAPVAQPLAIGLPVPAPAPEDVAGSVAPPLVPAPAPPPATGAVSSNRRLLHGRRLLQGPNPEQTFNIQLPVAADQRAQTVQQLQSALQDGQLLSALQAAGLDVSQVAEGIIDGQVVFSSPVSSAAPLEGPIKLPGLAKPPSLAPESAVLAPAAVLAAPTAQPSSAPQAAASAPLVGEPSAGASIAPALAAPAPAFEGLVVPGLAAPQPAVAGAGSAAPSPSTSLGVAAPAPSISEAASPGMAAPEPSLAGLVIPGQAAPEPSISSAPAPGPAGGTFEAALPEPPVLAPVAQPPAIGLSVPAPAPAPLLPAPAPQPAASMTVNVTLRLVGSRAGAFGSSSEETVRAAIDALLSAAGPAPAALPAAPATAAVSSNRRLLHGRRLQQRPNPEQTFNIQLPVAADQRAQTVQQLQSALQNGQLLSDLQAAGLDVSQVAEGIIDGQVVYNGPPVSPAAPPAASPGPAPGFIPVTPQPAKSGSSIAGIAGGIAGGVVALLLFLLLACCLVRRKRRRASPAAAIPPKQAMPATPAAQHPQPKHDDPVLPPSPRTPRKQRGSAKAMDRDMRARNDTPYRSPRNRKAAAAAAGSAVLSPDQLNRTPPGRLDRTPSQSPKRVRGDETSSKRRLQDERPNRTPPPVAAVIPDSGVDASLAHADGPEVAAPDSTLAGASLPPVAAAAALPLLPNAKDQLQRDPAMDGQSGDSAISSDTLAGMDHDQPHALDQEQIHRREPEQVQPLRLPHRAVPSSLPGESVAVHFNGAYNDESSSFDDQLPAGVDLPQTPRPSYLSRAGPRQRMQHDTPLQQSPAGTPVVTSSDSSRRDSDSDSQGSMAQHGRQAQHILSLADPDVRVRQNSDGRHPADAPAGASAQKHADVEHSRAAHRSTAAPHPMFGMSAESASHDDVMTTSGSLDAWLTPPASDDGSPPSPTSQAVDQQLSASSARLSVLTGEEPPLLNPLQQGRKAQQAARPRNLKSGLLATTPSPYQVPAESAAVPPLHQQAAQRSRLLPTPSVAIGFAREGMLGSSAGEATQALGERLALNDGTPVHVGPEGVTDDISLIALAGIVRLREIADDAARNTGSEPSSPTAAYSHPAPAVNQQSEFQLGRAGAAGAGEGAQEKAGMDLSVANLRDVAMMLANNQDRRHFEAPANLHGAQTAIADLVTNGGEFAGRYALEGGSFSGQSVIVCTAHPMHEPNAAAVACRFYLDPKMYVRELLFLDEVPTTTSIREVFDTYDASPGSDSRTLPPCIITEHGDLSLEAWTAQRHPTAQQCIAALRTAVLAVEALHSRGLVHGSLSAACFEWFDAAESVKLVEYSTWAHAGDSVPLRLSLRTAPPEVLAAAAQSATELVADSAADMWALGLIIFELFAGEPLFGSTDDLIAMQHTDEDVVGMLLGLQPLPWESQPAFFAAIPHAGMRRLVQSLLRRGPEERPDIKQVLRHPALREVEVSGQPAKAEKPLVQPRWR